jgi:hypothetical protein
MSSLLTKVLVAFALSLAPSVLAQVQQAWVAKYNNGILTAIIKP